MTFKNPNKYNVNWVYVPKQYLGYLQYSFFIPMGTKQFPLYVFITNNKLKAVGDERSKFVIFKELKYKIIDKYGECIGVINGLELVFWILKTRDTIQAKEWKTNFKKNVKKEDK